MAGGGVWPGLRRLQRKVEGGFLKGSERPEAGCLGEFKFFNSNPLKSPFCQDNEKHVYNS